MLSSFWGSKPQQPTAPSQEVVEPSPEVVEEVKEMAVVAPSSAPEPIIEDLVIAPVPPGEKLVLLGVKVRPDTKKTLGELASLAGVTVSTYVRGVLERVRR